MGRTGKKPLPPYRPPEDLGLTDQEVLQRQTSGWSNHAATPVGLSGWQIVVRSCVTYFNIVFLILAVLLMLAGSSVKNLTFLVVVIINTVIGCVQQLRAKHAVDQLSLVAEQKLQTLRSGVWQEVPSRQLVRDDIVAFHAGDQICADCVVLSGQLLVNEALLTGESEPVVKEAGSALLSGSFVVAGTAHAQLTGVGDDSFAATLTREARKNPKVAKSEMMRALDKLILVLGILLIPVGLLLFYQEFHLLSLSLRESAETTVAALVGMIPEGLYLLTSLALALSTLKLARKQVLVQDMNCIEALARVDVLCVDKTGTITQPSLEVTQLLPLGNCPEDQLRAALAALYGNREADNETAKALTLAYGSEPSWKTVRYIPFTAQTQWCGGEFENHGAWIAGAPSALGFGQLPQVQQAAKKGLRVLLLARHCGSLTENIEPATLTPLALILLRSRIRENAAKTFSYFTQQGVSIKVLSGDDPVTASCIAEQAGIPHAQKWVDTSGLDEAALWEAAEQYTVFGRVTPEKKRILIRALQGGKHTVAMTGDGVNDVLAMKQADCAIAMASGAKAACQISQLVLLRDDFDALPGIVGEGRRVIHNIQRAASLFLVKNIFSLGLALLSFFTGLAYPMIPLHMSIISGLTIGVPSFFLALEPNYRRVSGKFLPTVLSRALPGGITNILVVLCAQIAGVCFDLPREQISTLCTALLAAVGMLVLYWVCRPFDKFRLLVWLAMIAALSLCFTLLSGFFEFSLGAAKAWPTLGALLLAAPAIFLPIQLLFQRMEKRKKS